MSVGFGHRVRGPDVGTHSRGQPAGDRDGPDRTVFESRIFSVPDCVSTSETVRFSASEMRSPAPYSTRNNTGSTIALFEYEDIGWESITANDRRTSSSVNT
ncbi:chaperone SurA, precursor [Mycolicibacterium novocastrense]|uniref:Chaperone SurA n=1 Tax=Mycolicibacterium novocastrense TaxID=59813 RepID=A0ABQ0KSZ3_MYCNV|nr:chaperone SurA, precursor [Mycolicibacterium novocastrense]